MITFYTLLVIVVILIAAFARKRKANNGVDKLQEVPPKWDGILLQKVNFYRNLAASQRVRFQEDVRNFLSEIRITGIQTDVTIEDRLLVASSAVIPLFGFPEWSYHHLDEVLLYPSSFDRDYKINSEKETITGMVGSGVMDGKMILSKPSLHLGFDISNDKKNVGIHEFVHLFDKETGEIDGIPPGFEDKAFALPWLEFVNQKTKEIIANNSDIYDYGATNRKEFFAVSSEYFFERPHLLKQKHPKLYETLAQVFHQDMTAVIEKSSFSKKKTIGRNDKCPCGSGEKYKHCCL